MSRCEVCRSSIYEVCWSVRLKKWCCGRCYEKTWRERLAAIMHLHKAPPRRRHDRGHGRHREGVTTMERLEAEASDCVLWDGPLHTWKGATGYGRIGNALAHRVAYEKAKGPIPAGLELHHICENRLCVNPDHLLAVTRREHKRLHCRGTHCKRGHEFTPENTYVKPADGTLICRACGAMRARRYRREKAA